MSLASCTISHDAWSDPRVPYLAQLAKYPGGADEAIGRLAKLWARCTYLESDVLSQVDVCACLGMNGETLIVTSGLGEVVEGGIRVKGRLDNDTGKDRLGWLGEVRGRSARGGKARASAAPRSQRGRFISEQVDQPVDQRHGQSPPAAPAGDQDQGSGSSLSDLPLPPDQLPDPRAIVRADLGADGVAPPAPEGWSPPTLAERQKLNQHAWDRGRLAHDLLRSKGIDPDAISWPIAPMGIAASDLIARVKELAEHGNAAFCREQIDRVVDVAIATAERDDVRHLRWLTPARLWARESFWKSLETSPTQAAQPRAGPRAAFVPRETPSLRKLKPA